MAKRHSAEHKGEQYYQVRSPRRRWSGIDVCSYFPKEFRNIVFRSWEVLSYDRVEEWDAIYDNVNDILSIIGPDKGPFRSGNKQIPIDSGYEGIEGSVNHVPLSAATQVLIRRKYFETKGIIKYPWYVWFAGMGLAAADEALTVDQKIKESKREVHEIASYVEYLGVRANEGIEAVAIAEQLKALNPIGTEVELAITEDSLRKRQAKKAIEKRHERLTDIKWGFIDFLETYKGKGSRTQLSKQYYQSLGEMDRRILSPSRKEENAARTLLRFTRGMGVAGLVKVCKQR